MKKVIVTTTINPPTPAIKKFEAMSDWTLVVIGDKKTPSDYAVKNGVYVTPEMQEDYDKALSDAIGWNCIQRRNFGFLWAKDMGAEVVAVVDDDNIPYDTWGENLFLGCPTQTTLYACDAPVFDPVGATNESRIWHRGFPLQLVPTRDYTSCTSEMRIADIQADFWNGDPDIDAVCRMVFAPNCTFDPSYFPLASTKIAPFNSQNTFLSKEVLSHYFLFPHVGRMDDIWAAFYVQAKGFKVSFGKASVFQDRNVHNLIKDMKAEYLGYENNQEMIEKLYQDPEAIRQYLPEATCRAWDLFRRHFA
jgi:hypothetical protein